MMLKHHHELFALGKLARSFMLSKERKNDILKLQSSLRMNFLLGFAVYKQKMSASFTAAILHAKVGTYHA